jgi:hypothetical protein
VKWLGYDEETWETEENLSCPNILEEYFQEKERQVYECESILQSRKKKVCLRTHLLEMLKKE